MKLSKRIEFGIRAVEELYTTDEYVRAELLAETIGTTKTFLEQILNTLKNANIVEIKRGRNGGCQVANRHSAKVFMAYDVAVALGYKFDPDYAGSPALAQLYDGVEEAWKDVPLYCEAKRKKVSNE